ncbi:hypothetical protein CAOG_02937 [Capsaspora owczarzaki ATCC 30864]|uniref:Uncharacterized protein n=1 Tax=Capsaspora owczarzaki (strain ATCC 30864) TaxID=595528 RepID=A0A0D2WM65_CAPO3|nr:hypothetical protein CAOG_02937 [Capsaspora owczarzaki ATCC 30864]KJE91870.1 hypothetical protein CAOG_002937 [Capsaspora owczarzaki ATCC 30864]|eukprot:XP_004363776.1 hypothetical protein CAOG_02937 [Capsaspora owczarzaki ATCC 30864]
MSGKSKVNPTYFAVPGIGWWIAILGGLLAFEVSAFHPDSFPFAVLGPLASFVRWLSYEHSLSMQIGFVVAIVVHVFEGAYAYSLASKLKLQPKTVAAWTIQSFICGFPSLRLLLAYKRKIERSK